MKSFSLVGIIKNLGLLTVSTVFTVILAEVVVRTFFPIDTGEPWRMPAPHGQNYLVNNPLSNVRHAYKDYATTYSINSLGYRGPERGDESIEVAFLGDSFTFGLFVDEQDTSVGLIRFLASSTYGPGKVAVANAAIAGSGLAEWIAYMEDYGQRLKANIVVLNLNYVSLSRGYKHPLFTLDCVKEELIRNEKPEIDHRKPWPIFKRYDDRDVTTWLAFKRWVNDHSQLFMTVRKGYQELLRATAERAEMRKSGRSDSISTVGQSPPPKTKPEPVWFNAPYDSENIDGQELKCFVRATMKSLQIASKRAGAKLVVIDIGYRWQTKLERERSIDLRALEFVPQVLADLGVPYADLTDTMLQARRAGAVVMIPGDGHPNKEGYRLIAQGSWPVIKSEIDVLMGQ
jgi:hypothetical protein